MLSCHLWRGQSWNNVWLWLIHIFQGFIVLPAASSLPFVEATCWLFSLRTSTVAVLQWLVVFYWLFRHHYQSLYTLYWCIIHCLLAHYLHSCCSSTRVALSLQFFFTLATCVYFKMVVLHNQDFVTSCTLPRCCNWNHNVTNDSFAFVCIGRLAHTVQLHRSS